MSALEAGEPLVIRDTLAYFGSGDAGAQDLFLPGREPVGVERRGCSGSSKQGGCCALRGS